MASNFQDVALKNRIKTQGQKITKIEQKPGKGEFCRMYIFLPPAFAATLDSSKDPTSDRLISLALDRLVGDTADQNLDALALVDVVKGFLGVVEADLFGD